MLTLTEGSRPASDTDAVALAMSEEEDRLIEDALYFSEPDVRHKFCPTEAVASPTRSDHSVQLDPVGSDENSSPTKRHPHNLLAPSSSSPTSAHRLRRNRENALCRPLQLPYPMLNKKPKPSAVTHPSYTEEHSSMSIDSSPKKSTSSKGQVYELENHDFSPSWLRGLDLNRAESSPTSRNVVKKTLGLSSSLTINQSTGFAEQHGHPSTTLARENSPDKSKRPNTRMSLDTRLIGRRVAGGSWPSAASKAVSTDASGPPMTPKKRKEFVDELSSPSRCSRRPRVDGPLSSVAEESAGVSSQPIDDKDPHPKQPSSSKEPCRPQTPEDTSIVISPEVTPRRLKALIAKKKIRHRLEPFLPTVLELAHRKDKFKSQSEHSKQIIYPLPEIVITPPLIACPDSPNQQDPNSADTSDQGAFLATLHAPGRPDVHCAFFGDELRYGEIDVTYTSTSCELVLSRFVHRREKDDQSKRVLMLGIFRDDLKQIPKAHSLSGADPTQAQVLQAIKPFVNRLTCALSRKKQEYWVPDSLKAISMHGIPQEVSDKWSPILYRQELLELADDIVTDVVNCIEAPGMHLAGIEMYAVLMRQVIRSVKVEGIEVSPPDAPPSPTGTSQQVSLNILQDPEYPSRIVLERLQYYMEVLLQSGIDLAARGSRLDAPPVPKNAFVWDDYLDSVEEEREQKQTLRQARSDEVVQNERKEAAVGRAQDAFVPLTVVKFLGELYGHDLLSMHLMQRWLHRLLVETVYPGLPSLWELEAACVLLIVILPRLHRLQAEAETRQQEDGKVGAADSKAAKMERGLDEGDVAPSTPKRQKTVHLAHAVAGSINCSATEQRAAQELQLLPAAASPQRLDAPADHWIHLTPSKVRRYSMSLPSYPAAEIGASAGPAATSSAKSSGFSTSTSTNAVGSELDLLSPELSAAEVVQYCMTRLRQLRTVADIHYESREWNEAVLEFSGAERAKHAGVLPSIDASPEEMESPCAKRRGTAHPSSPSPLPLRPL